MTIRTSPFLTGVPEDTIRTALAAAGGNEIESGKLDSPESSAALAVNAFGWFLERPADLPPFPPLADLDWPARRVDVERQMRFPWRGGRHPWLDAAVETASHLIGVESKRFEPFRDSKTVNLSDAYDRDVWGDRMAPFTAMRDALRREDVTFTYLDGVQLVKHAFGLVTEGNRIRSYRWCYISTPSPQCAGTASSRRRRSRSTAPRLPASMPLSSARQCGSPPAPTENGSTVGPVTLTTMLML